MEFNFSANTGYLWKELPFIDRIKMAKVHSFNSLEFHDEPHEVNLAELKKLLSDSELNVNGMNVRMGERLGVQQFLINQTKPKMKLKTL